MNREKYQSEIPRETSRPRRQTNVTGRGFSGCSLERGTVVDFSDIRKSTEFNFSYSGIANVTGGNCTIIHNSPGSSSVKTHQPSKISSDSDDATSTDSDEGKDFNKIHAQTQRTQKKSNSKDTDQLSVQSRAKITRTEIAESYSRQDEESNFEKEFSKVTSKLGKHSPQDSTREKSTITLSGRLCHHCKTAPPQTVFSKCQHCVLCRNCAISKDILKSFFTEARSTSGHLASTKRIRCPLEGCNNCVGEILFLL